MFFILPLTIFGLSLLGPYPLYTILSIFVFLITILQSYFPNTLPTYLQTWKFLPAPFRSLDPYDKIFTRCFSKSKTADVESCYKEEESCESSQNLIFKSPIIKNTAATTLVTHTLTDDFDSLLNENLLLEVKSEKMI